MELNLQPIVESITSGAAGVGDAGYKLANGVKLDEVPNGFSRLITEHTSGYWGSREGNVLNVQSRYGTISAVAQHNTLPFSSVLGRRDSVDLIHAAHDPAGYSAIRDAWDAAANQLGTKPVRDWGAFGPEGGESGGNYRAAVQYVRGNGDGTGVRLLEPADGDAAGADARLQLDRAFSDYQKRNKLETALPSGE
jgi:hypothetical protein